MLKIYPITPLTSQLALLAGQSWTFKSGPSTLVYSSVRPSVRPTVCGGFDGVFRRIIESRRARRPAGAAGVQRGPPRRGALAVGSFVCPTMPPSGKLGCENDLQVLFSPTPPRRRSRLSSRCPSRTLRSRLGCGH